MAPSRPQSVLKGFSINLAARIIRGVLGAAQFVLLAHLFGAGAANDAWQVATAIPFLVLGFLSWALHSSFIAVYAERREREGLAATESLVDGAYTLSFIVMGALTLALWIGAPLLIATVAPGFDGERYDTAVRLLRWFAPLCFLGVITQVPAALFTAARNFTVPAVGSICYNLGLVLLTVLLGRRYGITVAAVGGTSGVVIEALYYYVMLRRNGRHPRLTARIRDPDLMRVLRLIGPTFVSSSIARINRIIDTWFASVLPEGIVTALGYGGTLTRIPNIIFTGPLAHAVIPVFADQAALRDTESTARDLARYMRLAIFVATGIGMALIALPEPLIGIAFQRGAFDAKATHLTALAMQAYALAMPVQACRALMSVAFVAMQDTKTPMRIAIVGMVLNAAADYVCVRPFGHQGIALATSIVSATTTAMLAFALQRKLGSLDGVRTLGVLAKCLAAGFAGGLLARWVASTVDARIAVDGLQANLAIVLPAILLGGGAYVLSCVLLQVHEVRDAWRMVASRIRRLPAKAI